MSNNLKIQFLKYIVVGSIVSATFIVIGNLIAHFFSHLVATFFAYLLSGCVGYLLQMRITFKARAQHSRMSWKYVSVTLMMLGYGEIITYFGAMIGAKYVWVNLFIAATIPLFSFPLQKFWVYRCAK